MTSELAESYDSQCHSRKFEERRPQFACRPLAFLLPEYAGANPAIERQNRAQRTFSQTGTVCSTRTSQKYIASY